MKFAQSAEMPPVSVLIFIKLDLPYTVCIKLDMFTNGPWKTAYCIVLQYTALRISTRAVLGIIIHELIIIHYNPVGDTFRVTLQRIGEENGRTWLREDLENYPNTDRLQVVRVYNSKVLDHSAEQLETNKCQCVPLLPIRQQTLKFKQTTKQICHGKRKW